MSQSTRSSEIRAAAAEARILKKMTPRERQAYEAEQARRRCRAQIPSFAPICVPDSARHQVFDTRDMSLYDIELAQALAESSISAESEDLQRHMEALTKVDQEESDYAYAIGLEKDLAYAQNLADYAYAQELASNDLY